MLFTIAFILVSAPATKTDSRIVPATDPRTWVTPDDYPPDARRDRIEGTVSVTLDVDQTGVSTRCNLMASSGSKTLDDKACALLLSRARFTPGRDDQGHARGGQYNFRFRWALAPIRLEPALRVLRLDIDVDGSVYGCEVVAHADGDDINRPCEDMKRQGKFVPFTDASGKPVRKVVIMRNEVEVRDPEH